VNAMQNLLVVINPTLQEHVALRRALDKLLVDSDGLKVTLLVGVDVSRVDDKPHNDTLFRNEDWIESELASPLREAKVDYEIVFTWCSDWVNSILKVAHQIDASMILLRTGPLKASFFRFSDSKWELFKAAKCPVMLVRDDAENELKTLLAAVNFQAKTTEQKILNTLILSHAKRISDSYGAELHVVNAYHDSLSYPNRGALAEAAALPASRIHVYPGYSNQIIKRVAADITADLVVIGTMGPSGAKSSIRGNTAERIISSVDVDVLLVNSEID